MNPMKTIGISTLFLLGLNLVYAASLNAQDKFEVDNSHSSILFSISHFNIGYIYGRFNTIGGTVVIDKADADKSAFEFSIKSNSIDTNDIGRDNHLKSTEFFDVENHPEIEFKSQQVRLEKGTYNVTGKMKIAGVEKQVTLPLQLLGVGKGPFGNTRMGMMGKFSIKRSDFGIDKMLDTLGDKVSITFCFQGILK